MHNYVIIIGSVCVECVSDARSQNYILPATAEMSKKQLNSRESLFLSINLNLDVQASLDKISYRKHSVVAFKHLTTGNNNN